jgi:hypothetical protein
MGEPARLSNCLHARRTGFGEETTMDRKDDHAASGTRLAARPADDRGRIELALAHAESHMARMQPSLATQRVKDVLESFRRTVDGWAALPPTEEEARALREQVEQTLQLAKSESPTVRLRRVAT